MRGTPNRHVGRPRLGPFGMLVVLVALVSQLTLGALVVPDGVRATQLSTLDAASVLCQPGGKPSDRAPIQRHGADYALCPLSIALALPSVIVTPSPVVPEPSQTVAHAARTVPQARAPPSHVFAAAYPRGPPSLALI